MPLEDPSNDLLAYHAFPRLAVAIRTCVPAITEKWETAVRQTLPTADEFTLEQLRNSVPLILSDIADALASDKPAATRELAEGSKDHGRTRFHDHYNVRELVVEYRLLRRVVIEQAMAELGDKIDARQNVALNMAVDTAVQSGIVAFTEHQREQIRSASESQSRYMSFLSHDLRNHLNHATLVLQLLRERLTEVPDFADSVEDVSSIQKSIYQTMAGMDRLLQAERLRSKAVEPKVASVDLNSVFSEISKRVAHEAEAKGLELMVDVPRGARVHSDEELILLALQNLVGNAIKYSAEGRVTLAARRSSFDGDGAGWVLAVSDEGPGIAPEKLGRLFDAFSRGETHGQAGLGLGLSIASQAAKLLRGKLKVESAVGKGASFSLLLPE